MYYKYYNYIKNKYFEEVIPLPPVMRAAVIFKHTCEEIPISIHEGDVLAGLYGSETEEEYKETENKEFPTIQLYSAEELKIKDSLWEKFHIRTKFSRGHTCIDYAAVLNKGLKNYEKEILRELKKQPQDEMKNDTLKAMLVALQGAKIFAERFATLANKKYTESGDNKFLRMKETLLKVPYEPCETFYEAVSAVWIMHSLLPISDNSWSSISLGRIDQYLYPFYVRSLQKGETRDEIKTQLKNLFRFLNTYGDGACAMNLGGMNGNGDDQLNDLSTLILEVEKEFLGASPILAVRVNPKTPERFLDECIDLRLFRIGQPTFYGEIPCRNAMIKRGMAKNDAVNFSVNSCMGLHVAGKEIASMWGCVFNMHLPLELAVNRGRGLIDELPFPVPKTDPPKNLKELLNSYRKYLRLVLGRSLSHCFLNAKMCALNTPNPFLSALTENCIKSGSDRAVSATYRTETVETMGLANTANAIRAIDTLVYKQKKYTLEEFVCAAQNNFKDSARLLSDIKACEKYGTNCNHVDTIASTLCKMTSRLCKEMNRDNVRFIPSLHTLDTNVRFGKKWYTTLDGRLEGEPIAKNAGPTNDVRTSDPTNILISASKLPQTLFSGGQPVDLYFSPSILKTKEKRDKVKALIKTYFQLGGLQLQVNSIDINLLEKAYENPKEYPHLIVRIGGYSCPFVELNKQVQSEFIERFKKET